MLCDGGELGRLVMVEEGESANLGESSGVVNGGGVSGKVVASMVETGGKVIVGWWIGRMVKKCDMQAVSSPNRHYRSGKASKHPTSRRFVVENAGWVRFHGVKLKFDVVEKTSLHKDSEMKWEMKWEVVVDQVQNRGGFVTREEEEWKISDMRWNWSLRE